MPGWMRDLGHRLDPANELDEVWHEGLQVRSPVLGEAAEGGQRLAASAADAPALCAEVRARGQA